jgi:hypothetical protein
MEHKFRKNRGFSRFFLIAGVRPFTLFLNTGSRELQAHVFLGPGPRKVKNLGPSPTGPRPGVFFTNIQDPACTWTYRDHSLTTYNWLSRENNRYTIISCCLFLSINAPKIKSCRLVEKRRTKVLYADLSSTVFRF